MPALPSPVSFPAIPGTGYLSTGILLSLEAAAQIDLRKSVIFLQVCFKSFDTEQHRAVGIEAFQHESSSGCFQIRKNPDAIQVSVLQSNITRTSPYFLKKHSISWRKISFLSPVSCPAR